MSVGLGSNPIETWKHVYMMTRVRHPALLPDLCVLVEWSRGEFSDPGPPCCYEFGLIVVIL